MKRMIAALLLLAAGCAAAHAREVWPLDDGWRFYFQHENGSDNARPVTLPHTWNRDALAGCYPYLRTQGNYLREIYIPAEWQSRRLFLRFGGVQSTADLFVNGVHAGEHRGGSTAFTVEITDKVRYGAVNMLLVTVNNAPVPDVLPTSAEHNIYGGIYRNVELLLTDRTAVSPLYLGTEGILVRPASVAPERVEGTAEIHLLLPAQTACRLTLRATMPDGAAAFEKSLRIHSAQQTVTIPFVIDKPLLWSPSQPNLYRFTATVETETTSDSATVETGFRTISVDARNGMSVNGERISVRGVVLGYDREAAGCVLDREAYAADLALAREMGANAVRSPAGPHGADLYDLCDRSGMLAWIDLPFIRAPYMGEIPYFGTPAFEQNGLQQLREIVAQHMNHPSVAMWGLFTELRPVDKRLNDYIGRLHAAARELDPSRPTVACSNQNGEMNDIPELIVWRQEAGWTRGSLDDVGIWSAQLHRNWGDLRSAVCYGVPGDPAQQDDSVGKAERHGTTFLPEGRQTLFHEEYARQIAGDSLFWGLWIDCLADFGAARRGDRLDRSGLVSFDRSRRKDAFYLYKAIWNDREPTLHLVGKRLRRRSPEKQVLKVYASGDTPPLLLVNGDTTELVCHGPGQYRTAELTLAPVNDVRVEAGELRDSAVIRCGSVLRRPTTTDPLRTIGLQTKD